MCLLCSKVCSNRTRASGTFRPVSPCNPFLSTTVVHGRTPQARPSVILLISYPRRFRFITQQHSATKTTMGSTVLFYNSRTSKKSDRSLTESKSCALRSGSAVVVWSLRFHRSATKCRHVHVGWCGRCASTAVQPNVAMCKHRPHLRMRKTHKYACAFEYKRTRPQAHARLSAN